VVSQKEFFDCLVVGTGPSSEPVIFNLSKTNLKVLIIDAGNIFDTQGKSLKGKREKYYSSLTPKQKYKDFNTTYNNTLALSSLSKIKSRNFSYISCFLSGGLSNFWGGGITEWGKEDILKTTSISPNEIRNSYAELKKRIKVINSTKVNELSNISKQIINKNKKGKMINFKRAKILSNYKDHNFLQLDEKYSQDNLIWNSKESIRKYINNSKNITYFKKYKAIKIDKNIDNWIITCETDNKITKIYAKSIFLCAGCINSTILSFTALREKEIELSFSHHLAGIFPIINLKKIPKLTNKFISLPELSWSFKSKSNTVLASGYIYNWKLIFENLEKIKFFRTKFLKSKIFPIINFISIYIDNDKNKLFIKKILDTNRKEKFILSIFSKNNLLKDWFKLVKISFSINKFIPNYILIINFFMILIRRGGDIHYGCTMPEFVNTKYPLRTNKNGELLKLKNIYICDSSRLSSLSSQAHTFTIMAIVNSSMKNILKNNH
tara:strand:+ start:193 stop:1671 length:1479 start_codon:yes stop_codon:yes gene_type:complete